MLTDFDEPHSLEEAEEDKRVIIAEIQEIQAQLGDRNRKRSAFVAGPLSVEEYWKWRTKAIWALTNRQEELRWLKEWIKKQYQVTA